MKFANEGRKEVTFAVVFDGTNQPLQHQTVYPGQTVEFKMGANADESVITVRGGLLYSGEDKEFNSLELQSMRRKLEQALLKVRSEEGKNLIEEVIYQLGY